MKNNSHSFLVDWTKTFIKNKDIIHKKIEKIENNKEGFDLYVRYKDKERYFIITPEIQDIDVIIGKLNEDVHVGIVVLNSKKNFEIIVKNWKRFIDFKSLSIIFVNPFSGMDKKWIVFPHTHHKISEGPSLENGLKSMFNMVEPIDEEELIRKITS